MSIATADRKEWMLPSHAAKALGISTGTLRKVAPRMGIRCRQIPGMVGRLYNRTDVDQARTRMEQAEAAQVASAPGFSVETPRRAGRPRKQETARSRH